MVTKRQAPPQVNSGVLGNPIRTTYANIVIDEEGLKFDFIQFYEIEGVKCARIEMADVEPKIEYSTLSIVCCVCLANPPPNVEGFFNRIWANIHMVLALKDSLFSVQFCNTEERDQILKQGPYFFDKKPIILQPWHVDLVRQKSNRKIAHMCTIPWFESQILGAAKSE